MVRFAGGFRQYLWQFTFVYRPLARQSVQGLGVLSALAMVIGGLLWGLSITSGDQNSVFGVIGLFGAVGSLVYFVFGAPYQVWKHNTMLLQSRLDDLSGYEILKRAQAENPWKYVRVDPIEYVIDKDDRIVLVMTVVSMHPKSLRLSHLRVALSTAANQSLDFAPRVGELPSIPGLDSASVSPQQISLNCDSPKSLAPVLKSCLNRVGAASILLVSGKVEVGFEEFGRTVLELANCSVVVKPDVFETRDIW